MCQAGQGCGQCLECVKICQAGQCSGQCLGY